MARLGKVELLVSPLLDEGSRVEARAREFLSEWLEDTVELTVVCSHGDWIPAFLRLATGTRTELAKGGWAELELAPGADGQPRLTWLLQELKPEKRAARRKR